MFGGALMVRMPTATVAVAARSPSSSRAASASNLVLSRAGCRAAITGARRASGFAVSSPMRRRQIRAKASPPAVASAASALFSQNADLDLAAFSTHSAAAAAAASFGDLAEGLEEPVQALYLVFLLGFLVVGAYLVVRQVREPLFVESRNFPSPFRRTSAHPPPSTSSSSLPHTQVLIRRELEEAAKVLGERIRTKTASPEDSFELGVILLRKKLYTSALKNLERARSGWDGAPADLAQVHNAIGYANFQLNKLDAAVASYEAAVELQPG